MPESLGGELTYGCRSRVGFQLLSQRYLVKDSSNRTRQILRIAGLVANGIDTVGEQLDRSTCGCDDNGATARHRFGNRQAERLGPRTRMNDDI